MQAKKPGGSSGGGRSGELQGDEAQRNKKKKKKVSCFSNIKIFLVSECALMLAQGTVGAYLEQGTFYSRTSESCGLVEQSSWTTSKIKSKANIQLLTLKHSQRKQPTS